MVVLIVIAMGSIYTYAAFIEPTLAPASSNQDFSQNIIGANNANNDFSSTLVAGNATGSLIERIEYIITAIAALWTKSGDDLYYTTGNVGIGTTTPSALLEVSGTGAQGIKVTDTANSITTGMWAGTGLGYIGTYTGTNLHFLTGGTTKMVVTNGGKIGIGNTDPSALLTLGTAGTTAGTASFAGATSGVITINTAAEAGTYSLTLPTTDGDASQYLQTNGSGVLSWAAISSSLAGLSDTTITAAVSGDFLRHNGTAWVDATLSTGDIPDISATYQSADADLTDLADGTLSASKVENGTYFISSAGTNGQVWKSDGAGIGGWGTDNNTTYSVGNGSLTEINFTSVLNTKLSGIATGATANVGDITGIINGTGISGGCTSGTCTLSATLGTAIEEGEIVQNTLDDSEVATDGLTSSSIADEYVYNTSDTMSGTLGVGGVLTASSNIDLAGVLLIDASGIRLDVGIDGYVMQVNGDSNDGLFFDVSTNAFDFMEDGVERGYIDLDSGNLQMDGSVTSNTMNTVSWADTVKVASLNADLLDGLDSSAFGDATAANQTTILSRIGTNTDSASMSGSLFAG